MKKAPVYAATAALLLTAVHSSARDIYPYYSAPGYRQSTVAGLEGELQRQRSGVNRLENQLQDLTRRLGRLERQQNAAYPTGQQRLRGFVRNRDGSYVFSVRGARIEISREGDILIRSPGTVTIEEQAPGND